MRIFPGGRFGLHLLEILIRQERHNNCAGEGAENQQESKYYGSHSR